MIKRYTRPEMGAVWSEENKFRKWLDVELAALDALALHGDIPKDIPAKVRAKAKFDVARILEIEKTVQHDVIAFLTDVSRTVGPAARFLHFGMTSSDVLDTGLALQLKESSAILLKGLRTLIASLRKKASEHRLSLMVGRTHGIHAEPITFGLKMAVFYEEFKRHEIRLERAAEAISYGKISGAVGTFANVDPEVEARVCSILGLKPAPVSTQILQRDRHAEYLTTIALIGASLEKLATEIRGLQKTETHEVEEPFAKGQKGSSAMPHKKNPIVCERIVGLARLLRGNALAAMENVALWHERDISHSSVERVIFPDSTIALDYMLSLAVRLIDGLVVHKKQMLANFEKSRGMVFSQGLLLALVKKGLTREEAYRLVQNAAMQVWEDENGDFRKVALKDRSIRKHLGETEIEKVFDPDYHTKNISKIFRRLGIR
ncbi:MAG: adenylosuccinate lyase [Candidatus Omnitrophota bacterium]